MQDNSRIPNFDVIADRLRQEIKEQGGPVSYRITIEKTTWTVIESEPSFQVLGEVEGKTLRGFPPSRPFTEKVKQVVFDQIVNNLNIAEVAKVVNRF